jgi:hypothetical protein
MLNLVMYRCMAMLSVSFFVPCFVLICHTCMYIIILLVCTHSHSGPLSRAGDSNPRTAVKAGQFFAALLEAGPCYHVTIVVHQVPHFLCMHAALAPCSPHVVFCGCVVAKGAAANCAPAIAASRIHVFGKQLGRPDSSSKCVGASGPDSNAGKF